MWWKIYFWITALVPIFLVISFYHEGNKHIFALVLNLLSAFFTIISLYSFLFKKKFFSVTVWKYIFWIFTGYTFLGFLYILMPNYPGIKLFSFLWKTDKQYPLIEVLIISAIALLLAYPTFYALYQLSKGRFWKSGEKLHESIPAKKSDSSWNDMRFTVNYTYRDYYEAQKIFHESYKTKWILKIVGIVFIGISLKFFQIQLSNILLLTYGLFLVFLPYSLLVYVYLVDKCTRRFFSISEITINEDGFVTKYKRSTVNIKWKQVKKYLHNDHMLLLYSRVRFIPFLFLLTPIHKRFVNEKQWESLTGFIKQKMDDIANSKKTIKQNKFIFWTITAIFILISEADILIGATLLKTISNFDNNVFRPVYFYIAFAVAFPFIIFMLRIHKRFLKKSISAAVIIFFVFLFSLGSLPNQTNQQENVVKKEFTSDQFWNAVNDKRVHLGSEDYKKISGHVW